MNHTIVPVPPLGGPPPAEVPLAKAPLARVLAQVRFPRLLSIEDKSKVAPFQAELRAAYPFFSEDKGQNLKVELGQPGPVIQTVATTLWRFASVDRDRTITLTPEAVTLEAKTYGSRRDFLSMLGEVVGAVQRHFAPGVAERIAIRYVTRVVGEGYDRIDAMIRPGLLGVAIPEMRANVTHAVSEAAMTVEDGALMLRWGVLPPSGTIDPSVLEPVDQPSWIIDIDVSSVQQVMVFDADDLVTGFDALAQRAYAVFRYMVTDDFLKLHGGQP